MSTSTVVELSVLNDYGGNNPSWDVSHSDATTVAGSRGGYDDGKDKDGNIHPAVDSTTVAELEAIEMRTRGIISPEEDPEMRLPYMGSLCIILVLNALLQVRGPALVRVYIVLMRSSSRFSCQFPLLPCMQRLLVAMRYFLVSLSVFPPWPLLLSFTL